MSSQRSAIRQDPSSKEEQRNMLYGIRHRLDRSCLPAVPIITARIGSTQRAIGSIDDDSSGASYRPTIIRTWTGAWTRYTTRSSDRSSPSRLSTGARGTGCALASDPPGERQNMPRGRFNTSECVTRRAKNRTKKPSPSDVMLSRKQSTQREPAFSAPPRHATGAGRARPQIHKKSSITGVDK